MVEVWVAAKDLPIGTVLHKEELPTLIVKKRIPKAELPESFVVYEEDLYGMRLTHALRKEEPFDLSSLTNEVPIRIPKGMDLASLSLTVNTSTSGMYQSGRQVQILALGRLEGKLVAFPLFENILIVASDHPNDRRADGKTDLTVSFAMDESMFKLLMLAQKRGCKFALIRQPGYPEEQTNLFPRMTPEEIQRLTKFVDELQPAGDYSEKSDHITFIAPAPRPKPPQP